jgi:LacI family transcriptional regulator
VSRRGFLDGLLVQSGDIRDRLIERLQHAGIPFVVAGRPFHTAEVNFIDVDNIQAAYQAVIHLAGLGRKRIAAITGSLSSTVSLDRKEGYLQAISAQACALEPALMVESDFTEQGGYSAMQQLLPAQPDAVFAASDTMAIGAMRAARDAGVRIPEQMAFIGFDDLPMAATTNPPLTTVHQPIFDFGVQAVELLLDVIENGVLPPRQHILQTRLVIRQSCGARQAV